jgi:hypothetical protein
VADTLTPRHGVDAVPPRDARLGNLRFEDLRQMALSELEWIARHASRAATRLNAIKEIVARTDPVPKVVNDDPQRPIAVAIFLAPAAAPRALSDTNGVVVHRSGQNGHEA